MHKSLQPGENRKILLVWVVGLALVFAFVPTRTSLAALAIALPLGVIAGILQRIALAKHQPVFLAANTAMDVRRAMTASKQGTASLVLQWATLLGLAVLCLRALDTVPSLMVGLLAFNLARDTTTYSAVVVLSRVADAPAAPD